MDVGGSQKFGGFEKKRLFLSPRTYSASPTVSSSGGQCTYGQSAISNTICMCTSSPLRRSRQYERSNTRRPYGFCTVLGSGKFYWSSWPTLKGRNNSFKSLPLQVISEIKAVLPLVVSACRFFAFLLEEEEEEEDNLEEEDALVLLITFSMWKLTFP